MLKVGEGHTCGGHRASLNVDFPSGLDWLASEPLMLLLLPPSLGSPPGLPLHASLFTWGAELRSPCLDSKHFAYLAIPLAPKFIVFIKCQYHLKQTSFRAGDQT